MDAVEMPGGSDEPCRPPRHPDGGGRGGRTVDEAGGSVGIAGAANAATQANATPTVAIPVGTTRAEESADDDPPGDCWESSPWASSWVCFGG